MTRVCARSSAFFSALGAATLLASSAAADQTNSGPANASLANGVEAAPAAVVKRHVLVIGVNRSVDENVPALDYADDDAARYAETLQPGAASLHLLAVLDADTQQRFPKLAREALPPTRASLEQVAAAIFASMQIEKQQGLSPELIFVYTGHGAVDGAGEGYVSLLDGRLTRGDLFGVVITPSPARFNHIIVDACSAYHLLNRGPEAVQAVRALLEAETLAAHPNTGALLATSRDRATHEWARIGGGVFSNEILSALNGAADVDGDGQVRYDEIGAFIEAANQGVADRRARIDLFLQPPALELDHALWADPQHAAPHLVLDADEAGHFAVVDARGVPVAEVYKNREQALAINLQGHPPFAVSRGDEHWTTGAAIEGDLALAALQTDTEQVVARSAISDALERGLYQVPFGRSYVRGYEARLRRELDVAGVRGRGGAPVVPQEVLTWWGYGALGGAGVAVVLSVASFIFGGYELYQLSQNDGAITSYEGQLGTTGLWAGGLLAATTVGALIVGGGLLLPPGEVTEKTASTEK